MKCFPESDILDLRRLSIEKFSLYIPTVGKVWQLSQLFYFGCIHFTPKKVLAHVTSAGKDSGSRRLFFSTVFPEQLHVFCAWQEKAPLNQTGSSWMQYIPLFLYAFRWNIEVIYYEQKTFWSLCSYMVHSRKGIEMLINLINIA